MADEQNNMRSFRLPVNAGTNTDEFSEDVPLQETSNFVMLPDGSGLKPREGFEVRRNDGISYGTGRKLMYFISNPPDIDYGDMIVLNSTRDGRQFIEQTEVVRTTNTRSLENPMSMPDLPPYVPPVPDIHPIFMAIGQAGETVRAETIFYDTATDTVTDAVILNFGGYLGRYAYVFRTENYIVGIDRRMYDDSQVRLLAWLISDCVDAPPEGPTPAVNISVYVDAAQVTPFKPVWVYRGDVVFMADDVGSAAHTGTGPETANHDYRLYKVDLATAAVTDVAITGLPSTAIGFINREYDCDSVCTDGYLWTCVYDINNRIMIKIDPVDGSVVADGVVSMYDTNYGLVPLPDGEMLYQIDDDTLMVSSADVQTQTALTNAAGLKLYASIASFRNAAAGTKMLAWDGTPSIRLCDIVSSTTIGSTLSTTDYYKELPGSFLPDASVAGFIRSETSSRNSWGYKTVDATTGAVISTLSFNYDATWANSLVPVSDAFAYGLQNIQGNRL